MFRNQSLYVDKEIYMILYKHSVSKCNQQIQVSLKHKR